MLECYWKGRTSEEHLMKADSLPLTDTHTHACHEWAAGDRASGKYPLSPTVHTHA